MKLLSGRTGKKRSRFKYEILGITFEWEASLEKGTVVKDSFELAKRAGANPEEMSWLERHSKDIEAQMMTWEQDRLSRKQARKK